MAIQVQIKVLPNPSGEVVKVSAGGMNLVGGTDRDSTVIEINPGDKMEITGEIEERVVYNVAQGAATKVPVHDVDGSESFKQEEAEAKKVDEEEKKKRKEETDKKREEWKKKEEERTGKKPGEAKKPDGEEEDKDDKEKSKQKAGSGAHVAGNITGSKEVKDQDAAPASKPTGR
jgi:hypothetical protein